MSKAAIRQRDGVSRQNTIPQYVRCQANEATHGPREMTVVNEAEVFGDIANRQSLVPKQFHGPVDTLAQDETMRSPTG